MRRKRLTSARKGFTLVEVLIASGVATVVVAAALTFLHIGTVLFAKNFSVTVSNNSLRGALDKLAQGIQQGDDFPILVDTGGVETTGAAPGIAFDRFLGSPYVVTHPGGTGLLSTATTFTVTRSTDALASPPIPVRDDVFIFDASDVRARVLSSSVSALSGAGLQTITVTLQSALGTAVAWTSSNVKTAKLVHRVGFIVMPSNGRSELRYYPSFEAVTDLNSAASYSVVTEQFASNSGETTPFSITNVSANSIVSQRFVSISLRARVRNYDQALANKQANDFQTFLRVDTLLRPKKDI